MDLVTKLVCHIELIGEKDEAPCISMLERRIA